VAAARSNHRLTGSAGRPKELAVFAGKLDYPSYGFLDRLMIRLIMWMTKGPTDPEAVIEFTDWPQVEKCGRLISRMLGQYSQG
jgi:menaquinone-dependent protoporphyrinogen oxidase